MSTTARWLSNKWRRLHLPTWFLSYKSLIHILNDDVLLHIFYVYLLEIKEEEEDENVRWKRCRQRWWYKLAWVCQRWRQLILASPLRLDLHLLCTYGVPVADMLVHSPPLPLTVFYDDSNREMTAEEEEGVLLALGHSDRLHRVALGIPTSKLGKFTTPMNEEFPILERICIESPSHDSTHLASLKTFRAPNLRHMWTSCLPIPSPLPPNTTSLVNLELIDIPASVYFPPSYILTRLSHTPQLETLVIHFRAPVPNRDVTRQLSNTPFTTNVTLPRLHTFSYRGVNAYLEGLLSRISAPSLNSLDVQFFNQLTFTVPRLLQFMQASEGLSFSSIELTFDEGSVDLISDHHRSWRERALRLQILCRHWQVATAAQILGKLSPVLSAVEELTLRHEKPDRSSELHNQVDETQWRELFMPLGSVKKLCVSNALFGEGRRSQSLHLEDKELFPDLLEVQYSGSWRCCGTEFKFKQEWDLHRLQEREQERLREQERKVEQKQERQRKRERERHRRVLAAAFAGPYSTMSHPGYPTPSHYTTNVAYDEPSSQVSSQLPYAYQGNQIIVHQGAGATQNTHDSSIVPGLRQPEYYTPPDHPHEIPNGVSIWHARQPPNVANLFQGLPGPVPPGISAEKELKQLASRYLRDPDSHVDRVRVRCSRCSGKVKVMILLELDEVE